MVNVTHKSGKVLPDSNYVIPQKNNYHNYDNHDNHDNRSDHHDNFNDIDNYIILQNGISYHVKYTEILNLIHSDKIIHIDPDAINLKQVFGSFKIITNVATLHNYVIDINNKHFYVGYSNRFKTALYTHTDTQSHILYTFDENKIEQNNIFQKDCTTFNKINKFHRIVSDKSFKNETLYKNKSLNLIMSPNLKEEKYLQNNPEKILLIQSDKLNTTMNTSANTTIGTTMNTSANTTIDTTMNTSANTTMDTIMDTTMDTIMDTIMDTTMNTLQNLVNPIGPINQINQINQINPINPVNQINSIDSNRSIESIESIESICNNKYEKNNICTHCISRICQCKQNQDNIQYGSIIVTNGKKCIASSCNTSHSKILLHWQNLDIQPMYENASYSFAKTNCSNIERSHNNFNVQSEIINSDIVNSNVTNSNVVNFSKSTLDKNEKYEKEITSYSINNNKLKNEKTSPIFKQKLISYQEMAVKSNNVSNKGNKFNGLIQMEDDEYKTINHKSKKCINVNQNDNEISLHVCGFNSRARGITDNTGSIGTFIVEYRNNKHLDIIKKLFPLLNNDNEFKNIKLDKDSICTISRPNEAKMITDIIIDNLKFINIPRINSWKELSCKEKAKETILTDMTAGVGGNVINFSSVFKYINAIEIIKERREFLINNLKVYKCINVNTYEGNSVSYLLEKNILNQDIIFCDPPWGGRGYRTKKNLRLTLDKKSIEEISNKLLELNKCQMVVLKLPKNYDMDYLRENIRFNIIEKELDKMLIVIIYIK